jgi:RHS repeat-associated protein
VQHDTVDPAGDVLVSVAYSDGFGRLLQTRTQAEDTLYGDAPFGGAAIPAEPGTPGPATVARTAPGNVVVTGAVTYDNKGHVVERYEPIFANGFGYAPPATAQLGQKATIFYDPRGHPVRTVNPDGSEQLVVLGAPVNLAHPELYAPTAWETFTYDANDNAGRTHADTAAPYADHWNTPESIEVDALGRTVLAVTRDGTEQQVTGFAYDVKGNLLAVTDPLGRPAFAHQFDLAGRRWRAVSIDAGRHDVVLDALGEPIEGRDPKGALTLGAFDALRRPIRTWARDSAGRPITLRTRVVYGDEGDHDEARAHNLLGRTVAHYDEAGLVTVEEVDFKGNVLETVRRVIADAPLLAVYDQAAADGWQVTPFAIDWDGDRSTLLDPTEYRMTTSCDALNRITRRLLPTDVEGRRREIVPKYNAGGGLTQVTVDGVVYVRHIAYDAKGGRTLIAYGNNVLTQYAYDPHTFRLARLLTQPCTPDGDTFRPTGPALQDYGYTYDLVGNVRVLADRTPGSGIVNTPAGPDALDRTFTYDPLYRLVSATGRECALPPDLPFDDRPRGVDLTRTRAYTETYGYDRMGGLQRLAHSTGPAGFVRTFDVAPDTNRLLQMTAGGTPLACTFDNAGNMTGEATTRHFTWNHADQLVGFTTQTEGAEPSLHAQYLYDASGARVTKLVRRQGGAVEVTHYLGDVEHHRFGGAANNHLHVMDDKARIALVRIGPAAPGDTGVAVQFHLGDHLGSATVVADAEGAVTNREEFTPYGETSFGSFARKRYRFTGKERDEESGLNYHAARYLSPGTGRFVSVDLDGGRYPGWSPYCYSCANPVNLVDPTGLGPEKNQRTLDKNLHGISDEIGDPGGLADEVDLANVVHSIRQPTQSVGEELAAHEALRAARVPAYGHLLKLKGMQKYLGDEAPKLLKGASADAAAAYGGRIAALQQRLNAGISRIAESLGIGSEDLGSVSAKWKGPTKPKIPVAKALPPGRGGGGGGSSGRGGAGPARRSGGLARGAIGAVGLYSAIGGTISSLSSVGSDIRAGHAGRAALDTSAYLGGALILGGKLAGAASKLPAWGRVLGAPAALVGSAVVGVRIGTNLYDNYVDKDVAISAGSWVEDKIGSRTAGGVAAAGVAVGSAVYHAPGAAIDYAKDTWTVDPDEVDWDRMVKPWKWL